MLYPCPISSALNIDVFDSQPEDSLIRAANIMLEVAKLVPMFCPTAPKKLALDPQKEELLLLRRLSFHEGDWNSILIPLVCQMHEAISIAGTNKSAKALACFGATFKEFASLLKICRPDLKLEINLNVLSKDLIN